MASQPHLPVYGDPQTIPISLFVLTLHEYAAYLHRWQAYADGKTFEGDELAKRLDELTCEIRNLHVSRDAQERVIRTQQDLIQALETKLQQQETTSLPPPPVARLHPIDAPLRDAFPPSPTYGLRHHHPTDEYPLDRLMVLAESVVSAGSTDGSGDVGSAGKRKAEVPAGGDAKRRGTTGGWS